MLIYLIIIGICIGVDQFMKLLAVDYLAAVTTVPIIPNVFHLTYVENDGAAFSLFSGQQTFLIVITFIFLAGLCYVLYALPKNMRYFRLNLAFTLIISGATGNLIDRLRFHHVVDFFDFRLIGFAIFNLADVFVVVGCAIVVIEILRNRFPDLKSS